MQKKTVDKNKGKLKRILINCLTAKNIGNNLLNTKRILQLKNMLQKTSTKIEIQF